MSTIKENDLTITEKDLTVVKHPIVEQMEKERRQDRSWTGKEILQRHKKIKLAIKDAIEDVKKTLGLNRS